jgi:hypothetical protein
MKTIKIRAGLKLASYTYLFHHQIPIANKMLFLKDHLTHEFQGTYVIPELHTIPVNYTEKEIQNLWKASNEFTLKELHQGLFNHQFYTLSEQYNSLEYNFKLILNEAEPFDFYDGPKRIKPNVLYYVKTSETEVTGPFYMKPGADFNYVMNAVNNGKLYVPIKKQTFEPYKLQAVS